MDLRWILLLIVILLIIILVWPDPASGAYWGQADTPTLTPTLTQAVQGLPTASLIPAEYLENNDQTSGIICGSVILVLIIVVGTLGVLRRRNGASPK